jgi:UDP-glucose 4-epimerase
MHFAGFAYVGKSVADPGKYYENNLVGKLTLLQAMRACNVSRIVCSSSCVTYGCRGIVVANSLLSMPGSPSTRFAHKH